MYKSRLTFDEEPLSIQKKYLPRLAAFLPFDGFQKKKMTLRLRMSQTSAVFGKFTDTLNRNTLLILLKTK